VGRFNVLIKGRVLQCGVDIPCWRVLLVLGEKSPRSLGAIAEATLINLSTLMRIVQRMQRAKLVTCRRGRADQRITDVGLTPAGRRKLTAARRNVAPIYQRLIQGFSAGEFDQLLNMLGRLQINLDYPVDERRSPEAARR
jgi:DNA-binding MarR family transcriptional regulator